MKAKNQPAMHIPDSAVYAFHSALSDAALGESEFAEIKNRASRRLRTAPAFGTTPSCDNLKSISGRDG